MLLYPIGGTESCRRAAELLAQAGIALTDHPSPEVTHLLLDVPSFAKDGQLRCGGALPPLLQMLPPHIQIIGGNLNQPCLAGYETLDLLRDPQYLARNAAITADCALRLAGGRMKRTFADSTALVIGWGRIGKCLSQLLRSAGAAVTVAARKDSDRAMAQALGYSTLDLRRIPQILARTQLIFNTVPAPVLSSAQLALCQDCLLIELASSPGLEGAQVIAAPGLPGTWAPQSSGALIAQTCLDLWKEESL